jgi:hypothetical protein
MQAMCGKIYHADGALCHAAIPFVTCCAFSVDHESMGGDDLKEAAERAD